VRQFLDHENEIARLSDARVETVQIFSAGGRAVREAAQTALAGSPADLTAFLTDGWKAPLEEDQRVRAVQLVSAGGPGVKAAGTKALNGTIEDV
ncbi:hypothetical protein G3M58_28250, partial [Streptomyces sp. SID7499]|nr:hypothetical protein [Streptomyces sp. SID7499]